jgi:L-asparagine oxygenase
VVVTVTSATVRQVALPPEASVALAGFCRRVGEDPYSLDYGGYDRRLRALMQETPSDVWALADSFGKSLGASGVAVLHGLPIPDDLPPTPVIPYFDIRQPAGTEPLVLGAGSCVGEVLAFPGWRGGDRVHNVYPMPDDVDTQKASNAVRLAFHTEAAFDPLAPEALVLLILRRAASAPPSTGFADLRQVFDGLPRRDQLLMSEHAFHPLSFDREGKSFPGPAQNIVVPWRGGLRFTYIPSILGSTPAHESALERFRQAIEEAAVELMLEPGDMVLIDNTHVAHGRTAQSPVFAGGDRWLQRCLVRGEKETWGC